MLRRSEYFTLMEMTPQSTYLNFFLNFHRKDIKIFFPSFDYKSLSADVVFFVLRNTIPAGLIIIRIEGNTGEIILDYALQDYRDFKIGAFIFEDNTDILSRKGIEKLVATGETQSHVQYLRQMGFRQDRDETFIKEIKPQYISEKEF